MEDARATALKETAKRLDSGTRSEFREVAKAVNLIVNGYPNVEKHQSGESLVDVLHRGESLMNRLLRGLRNESAAPGAIRTGEAETPEQRLQALLTMPRDGVPVSNGIKQG